MSGIESWGAGAATPGPGVSEVELCSDPTCEVCTVKGAGARVIAVSLGLDYDAEPPESKAQLMHLASHVYSSMSDAILNLPGIKHLGSASLGPEGLEVNS